METQRLALSLLFLVVLASGCSHTGGSGQESPRAINVNSFSVTPQEIYEDTSVRVSIDVTNTGNLPTKVSLGDNGEKVLKNYCPDIFSLDKKDFSVTTSGERDGNSVRLEPRDQMNLRWRLQQEGDVPLYNFKCNIEAEMEFNYSVRSYRQIQIKRDREVQGSPKLYAESSSGPMVFGTQTRGTTDERRDSFIATEEGENREILVLLQLHNPNREGYNKGVVDIQKSSLVVRASDPLELFEGFKPESETLSIEDCVEEYSGDQQPSGFNQDIIRCVKTGMGQDNLIWTNFTKYSDSSGPKCDVQSEEEIRLFGQGSRNSRVITCNVDLPQKNELKAPSEVSEIFAKVNYTYLKDVGSRTVTVKPRGN